MAMKYHGLTRDISCIDGTRPKLPENKFPINQVGILAFWNIKPFQNIFQSFLGTKLALEVSPTRDGGYPDRFVLTQILLGPFRIQESWR